MLPELRYPVPPRRAVNLAVATGLLTAAGVLADAGRSGRWGVMSFSAAASAHVLCAAAGVCGVLGSFAAAFLVFRLLVRQEIVLGADAIHAPPHPWATGNVVVRYADVRSTDLKRGNGPIAFAVVHAGGTLRVPLSSFDSASTFGKFQVELGRRCAAARHPTA